MERRRESRRELLLQKLKEKSGGADEITVTAESLAEALSEEWVNGATWNRELTETMRLANRIQGRMN